MMICRYLEGNTPQYGLIEEGIVYVLDGDPFSPRALSETSRRPALARGPVVGPLDEVKLLAPVTPGKILCLGRNYAAHAAERGEEVPPEPLIFFKPPTAVIGPGDAIELLEENGRVDHEAELAVVIGRRASHVAQDEALDYVFGYTCVNDVTDRDFQARDGQWWRAKGIDTFCPVGPWIQTRFDPADVRIRCRVNGESRQDGSTRQMIYRIPYVLSYITRFITLEPDDLVLTGTPAGVGPLAPGDVVEVEVEGIGVLSNPVRLRGA
ncbi:MAG: fumarylacetoacetate hydrolase family protein [Anaerolineae bacterium]